MSSVRDQIEILISKGMLIPSKKKTRAVLRDNNYYNVINAYKDLFIDDTYIQALPTDPDEKYKVGTSFDELYSMFLFDKTISEVFLKYFLQVENQFKTHLAYEFTLLYGENGYLNKDNFDTTGMRVFDVLNLISMINDKLYKNKGDQRVRHFYINKNKDIPIWAVVALFEIGKARNFYFNCKDGLKKKVSYYYSLTPNQLMSMLSTINMFRNVCAHDSRLYCYRIIDVDKQISDMPVHNYMIINRNSAGWYIYGKQDLFSAVIALKYLIDDSSFLEMIDKLKCAINNLAPQLHTISINDVLQKMGFPLSDLITGQKSWDEILNVPKF